MKTKVQKIKTGLLIYFLLYLVLYLVSYLRQNDYIDRRHHRESDFFESINFSRKNYASEKMSIKDLSEPAPALASQKYEMYSDINSTSVKFNEDEKKIKQCIQAHNAIIQYEKNEKYDMRQLHLIIGVNPEKFDSFSARLQKIGKNISVNITKTDKTNEYRELNAKKVSIEKSLASLTDLKSKSGQISEFVELDNKIRETETELQDLGVELGYFDSENEFCTVRISIYEESKPLLRSFADKCLSALNESGIWMLATIGISLLISVSIIILVFMFEKLSQLFQKFKS